MNGILLFFAYLSTVPLANWMIGHVGACSGQGPCVIPVGFGLVAPSGVLMIGASLMLRDAVQRMLGWRWGLAAIALGAGVSAFISPPAILLASVAAFLVSETADFLVYTPLAQRSLPLAFLASGTVGAVVDSALFLLIAFGSLQFVAGQVVGKMWVSVAAASIAGGTRLMNRHARQESRVLIATGHGEDRGA